MLGAGGTGGHIAPHLYRLLYALERPVRFIICDGDIVEEKNLVRQNFTPADLGENKARVLAERYSSVFGMETEYVPEFIESGERLLSMLRARTFPTGPYWHSPTVKELVIDLTAQLGDKRPVLVCVLKGASFFYIDLCRCMNCAIDMDFIAVSSYGASAQSTGVVRLIKDLDNNITGRHVVIVEDIIDSGLTMQYLRQLFGARNPASITTISFLDKASRHPESYKTDMCGFEIPDEFVVGYGLDYANYYRNLPYIGILKPECYK